MRFEKGLNRVTGDIGLMDCEFLYLLLSEELTRFPIRFITGVVVWFVLFSSFSEWRV